MKVIPNASKKESFMYIMLSTRPYIYFVVSIVSGYQSNAGSLYWFAIKHILKYLRRKRDYMLAYLSKHLIVSDFYKL
jgi:hypothetical protein